MTQSIRKTSIFIPLWLLVILAAGGMAATHTSMIKDQQTVALTIYNSNLGLVKETRLVYIQQGVHTL
ncbi:MAG: hypothetical protein NTX30_00360, partial [Deltaproteobacteria bacterium]|nr:hypothetical protein [Deltaproteobacteria bacterium]